MSPSDENFNGHLRRYLGKGTDLSGYSRQDLDCIRHWIDTIPRQIFRWQFAADRYKAGVVASTT